MAENHSVPYYKNGAINPDLVTTLAEDWANRFVPRQAGYSRSPQRPTPVSYDQKPAPITSAQLRRFYGDVKNLERRWQNSAEKDQAFREILPMIKLLKAKAAYAKSRKLVPDSFRDWIWTNVDSINDEKDFKAFLLYFEAVVGFCYGNGLKDGK